jgi:hypothetical protein
MFTHKSCLLVTIAALFVMKAVQMFLDKLWYIPTMNTTIIKNEPGWPEAVVQAYNPSHSGSRDWEDGGLRPAQEDGQNVPVFPDF